MTVDGTSNEWIQGGSMASKIIRFVFLFLLLVFFVIPRLHASEAETSASLPLSSASRLNSPYIVLWNRNFDTAPVDKFVALALAKTQDLYPATEVRKSTPMEQGEAIADLTNGSVLDVMSAASSVHDENFLTLSFPILKGLLGKRVCLIRKGEQSRFDLIRTAFDFAQSELSICQGSDWPDTDILKRNGLHVATSAYYQELFTMLKRGDCDCFLRGAQEVMPEYQRHQSWLALEEALLIQYSQPGVIYVRKSNPELAARLELGLLRAFDDGSYQQLLNRELGDSLSRLKLNQRRRILINNPAPSRALEKIHRIKAFDS
ncbi:MAG: hypothetical protein CL693_01305 [Cellvibrionaceae bacterium]|nr:hypothetical protein [Cellvibrionaceae bacterium]|tara:strand:+ start:2037 stop:2990 length:954 start_codon:yes stop_codon:yes gene_type:complete